MSRFFLEVTYKGTAYNGFQIQENADTVQGEVEKALKILHRKPIELTGSSRTDAGVHALQNFFHFDADEVHPQLVYKINAILPSDIAVKNIFLMPEMAHSRFDALSRSYEYRIHRFKDPFKKDLSFYYPYQVDLELLKEATSFIKRQSNFQGFCKTNTQVTNFMCNVYECEWSLIGNEMVFYIKANRFLRGMVRLLTGSLLKVGRGKLKLDNFRTHFVKGVKSGYSVPANGLYLKEVSYPEHYSAFFSQ